MEQASYIHSWKVERELKMLNQKDYMILNKDGDMKFPDAFLKCNYPNGLRTVALEYESREDIHSLPKIHEVHKSRGFLTGHTKIILRLHSHPRFGTSTVCSL